MDGEDAKLQRASGLCSVQMGCPTPFPRSMEATSENVRGSQGAEPESNGLEPITWQFSENSPGGTRSLSPELPLWATLTPVLTVASLLLPHGGRAHRNPLRPPAVV